MNLSDCTICIVLDAKTVRQFELTVPTWLRHHQELKDSPWLLVYDLPAMLDVASVVDRQLVPAGVQGTISCWQPERHDSMIAYGSQRERMLSAFVHEPPKHVMTTYMMKIDCDAVCLEQDERWPGSDWFTGDEVVVAPGCSRTVAKPRGEDLVEWFDRLEKFGDIVWPDRPRLNLDIQSGKRSIRHSRWKSWLSLYNIDWYREMADNFAAVFGPNRLPVPSQDSSLAYCTLRGGYSFRTTSMHGWTNCPRRSQLIECVEKAMQ
jgi:hypothetical protein